MNVSQSKIPKTELRLRDSFYCTSVICFKYLVGQYKGWHAMKILTLRTLYLSWHAEMCKPPFLFRREVRAIINETHNPTPSCNWEPQRISWRTLIQFALLFDSLIGFPNGFAFCFTMLALNMLDQFTIKILHFLFSASGFPKMDEELKVKEPGYYT